MQTNTNSKQVIPPKLPISTVSTLPTDYGSTTAAENVSLNKTAKQSLGTDQQHRAAEVSRFSSHGGRKTTTASAKSQRDNSLPNAEFGYQHLSDTDSRFPSFVNLQPASSNGRFRFHAMETSGGKHMPGLESALKAFEYSLNVLNHVLIGFVAIYMSWLCLRTGLAGTALHAWLVTIGFVLLMSEAILCYYPSNVLTFTYDRDIKTKAHWILQTAGGGLGMIGALIKLVQKGFLIVTTHGKLGFAAFILCAISMLSGLSALYSLRFKRLISPIFNKTIHNLLGYTTYVIAMLAQFYGYKTGYFTRKTESDFRDLMRAITILSLLLTSIGTTKTLLRKSQMIYRQYIK